MERNGLPSFLASLCLHLAVAALVLWWPAAMPRLPEAPRGPLISGIVTLGAPGKSIQGARNEAPKGPAGRLEAAQESVKKPAEDTGQKSATQVEAPDKAQSKPEVKTVTKPPEDTAQIKKDPEKNTEPKPEKQNDPEPDKRESKPEEKKTEKKPEKKTDDKKTPKADNLGDALADLNKQVDKDGSKGRKKPSGGGSGDSLSNALADLGKSLGGSGDDDAGRGPGGSGGDGIGMRGAYLDVIHSRVKANWSWPPRADRVRYSTLVNIQIANDGTITTARILRSSGNPSYDSSVMRALNLTKQLESPPEPGLGDIDIEFAF